MTKSCTFCNDQSYFCSGKFVWDYSEDKLSDGYNNWSEEEPNNDDDGEECVEKVRK